MEIQGTEKGRDAGEAQDKRSELQPFPEYAAYGTEKGRAYPVEERAEAKERILYPAVHRRDKPGNRL